MVFATLNDNVRKQADRFARLEVFLEAELAEVGVTAVTLEVFREADAVTSALSTGVADFYFDSPLIAAKVGAPAGAEMYLRRWKRGVGTYHSAIFVKEDSPIFSVKDLRGARVAMQEPTSTSGFLLPVALLADSGLTLVKLQNLDQQPPASKVGYLFTGDDNNTALWLVKGHVEAGATDDATFSKLQKAAPGQYRSIGRSREVPRQVVMMRSGMDPIVADKIADVLTSLHMHEEGREILRKFNKTTRFDRFEEGPDAVLSPLTEILNSIDEAGAGS
ncbi:MAG: phosphate/phosphite/phosphonate ABC transporter substrate-binding protein [Shimia sp.]|uniref:phosphate/phosphite/phosphonate ABC transporter substrate-binding protein n=1 Tax=Shimia sp. TaxID=1954381 RepID=UPI004058568B